jgi:hypothetical protein
VLFKYSSVVDEALTSSTLKNPGSITSLYNTWLTGTLFRVSLGIDGYVGVRTTSGVT